MENTSAYLEVQNPQFVIKSQMRADESINLNSTLCLPSKKNVSYFVYREPVGHRLSSVVSVTVHVNVRVDLHM